MTRNFSPKEQFGIIKDVEEKYSKFFDPNFDASIFLKYRDNFALTAHIESVKIFEMDNTPINPTFTIAIPTYNRCKTLKVAIDSALNQQTSEKYEIIVIENVDNFDTETPAQKMLEQQYYGKLTYYKNKQNMGLFGNLNRCLMLAKGNWVCILHSDDILFPSYLAHMQNAIKKDSRAILIGNLMYQEHWMHKIYSKIHVMDNLIFDIPIKRPPPSTLLHHRQKCIQAGGYNEEYYPSDDFMFVYRCSKYGKIYTYRKNLHIKGQEISTETQPKTRLQFCMIDCIFFLNHIKPKFFGIFFAYQHLNNHYMNFKKDRLFILADRVSQLINELKLEKKFYFFSKTTKILYIILRILHLAK